jgi:hypothetical protein
MQSTLNRKLLFISVIAAMLGATRIASANTITVTDDFQTISSQLFVYDVQLSSSALVKNGDGFVIYDFAAPVLTGAKAPTLIATIGGTPTDLIANGTFSVVDTLTGSPVPFTTDISNSGDSLTVDNVSFVYQPATALPGPLDATLTMYTSISVSSLTTEITGAASKDSGGVGSRQLFQGFVTAPISLTAVPEPSAGGMLAIAAIVTVCLGRKMSRALIA